MITGNPVLKSITGSISLANDNRIYISFIILPIKIYIRMARNALSQQLFVWKVGRIYSRQLPQSGAL